MLEARPSQLRALPFVVAAVFLCSSERGFSSAVLPLNYPRARDFDCAQELFIFSLRLKQSIEGRNIRK
jgi:hypothetical protein